MIKRIPENIDIEALIRLHPPCFKLDEDKLVHILSLIYEIPANNSSLIDNENGWIPIHTSILQRVGIRNFPEYRDWLITAGVWEYDHQYIVGKKSRCYRYTDKYTTTLKEATISKYTLRKAIKREYKKLKRKPKDLEHLSFWFNGKLTIDSDEAIVYLNYFLEVEKEKNIKRAFNKYNAGIISIDRLASMDYNFSRDETAGRLHTNLTNMKSELRNFIKYDGQSLVSVDYKNSQPFLSIILMNPEFWKPKKGKKNIEPRALLEGFLMNIDDIKTDITDIIVNSKTNSSKYKSSIMLTEYAKPLVGADVDAYITKAAEGSLYEYIEEQLKGIKDFNGTPKEVRRMVKEIVFIMLFTDNRFFGQDEAKPKRLFKQIFPVVYNLFAYIKRTKSEVLPILLQTIESELMLNRIAKRIERESPDLPIFTIHDSVVTTLGNEQYVKNVMIEEAKAAIGISPSVSIEYWNPDAQEISKQVA